MRSWSFMMIHRTNSVILKWLFFFFLALSYLHYPLWLSSLPSLSRSCSYRMLCCNIQYTLLFIELFKKFITGCVVLAGGTNSFSILEFCKSLAQVAAAKTMISSITFLEDEEW